MTNSGLPDADRPQPAENMYQHILATAMDGIISLNARQEIILFNAAAEAIFGYRAADVLGRPIDTLVPEYYRLKHRAQVEQFGRGEIPQRRMGSQRMVMALRSSGEEFPIETSISRATVQGELIYTIVLRDVTEAVRRKAQIQAQSQMLDQVSDAIKVVDLDGRITYWNQAAQRLFGWSAAEVLGKNAFELLYRGEPETLAMIRRETKAGHAWIGEMRKVTREGKPILVEHRQTALRDESGFVNGYLCLNIDVTDRRKREHLERRSQRLESIGTLAGGIAHDLNNVLTPILMGARLLASGRAAAKQEGLLQTMVASAERGAALIRQLLTFAGGVQGDRSPQRLEVLVTETRGMIEHTLPKSIQIETHVAVELPSVLGDATELTQVLLNLCVNARDAMPKGGRLTISADRVHLNGNSQALHPDARPGEYVLLQVGDTGEGMTPDVMDRIFDPFFTTKDAGLGTGLGLATVQGIVKSHGGFITVYSEPGLGSKFSIYLPATSPAAATGSQEQTAHDPTGLGRTVLIVDDEAAIRQMTSVVLEDAGYHVLTAQNGEEAIALFQRHRDDIALVLLDVMMPGMDGLQVLDELRRLVPQVVVIACSGLQTSEREAAALQSGAAAFLAKPYADDQLLALATAVLKPRISSPPKM